MTALITAVKSWLSDPFKRPLDAGSLFLVIGLVIVFVLLWARILAHIVER